MLNHYFLIRLGRIRERCIAPEGLFAEDNTSKAERTPRWCPFLAEKLGFEPRVPVRVRRISSAVHSTTLASLRFICASAKLQ